VLHPVNRILLIPIFGLEVAILSLTDFFCLISILQQCDDTVAFVSDVTALYETGACREAHSSLNSVVQGRVRRNAIEQVSALVERGVDATRLSPISNHFFNSTHMVISQSASLVPRKAETTESRRTAGYSTPVADETGQDIAEYAVMVAVILVIVVGTIRLIGSNANPVFSQTASSIT
jgi:Flp pilus assembly pilin Flp